MNDYGYHGDGGYGGGSSGYDGALAVTQAVAVFVAGAADGVVDDYVGEDMLANAAKVAVMQWRCAWK